MMQRALAGILLLLLSAATATPAGIDVQLQPGPPDASAPGPYRSAEVTVTNTTGRAISALRFRANAGGPALLHPMTVPPGETAVRSLRLQATSLEQRYIVTALAAPDAEAAPIASAEAAISWPGEMVYAGSLVDAPAAGVFGRGSTWPRRTRLQLLLLGAAVTALGGLVLVIGRPLARTLLALALVVAASAGACQIVATLQSSARTVNTGQIAQLAADGTMRLRRLIRLDSRTTGPATLTPAELGGATPWCVYESTFEMQADPTVIRLGEDDATIRTRVHPALGRTFLAEQTTRRADLPDALTPPRAHFQALDGPVPLGLVVDRPIGRSLLVIGNRYTIIEPTARNAPRPIDTEQSRLLANLAQGDDTLDWPEATDRLLRYWLGSFPRGPRPYLLSDAEGAPGLVITEIAID